MTVLQTSRECVFQWRSALPEYFPMIDVCPLSKQHSLSFPLHYPHRNQASLHAGLGTPARCLFQTAISGRSKPLTSPAMMMRGQQLRKSPKLAIAPLRRLLVLMPITTTLRDLHEARLPNLESTKTAEASLSTSSTRRRIIATRHTQAMSSTVCPFSFTVCRHCFDII
jgi:hypothetical protein